MAELFASGGVIDCILGFMLLELVIMAWWRNRSGVGLPMLEVFINLSAGAALLLALRTSLVKASWAQTAFWLLIALGAHMADLALRTLRASRSATRPTALVKQL